MINKKDRAKVGILTFHCSDNYGAMLQAYGLKQYLCTHGIKTDIVPYEPPYMTGRHWWIPYAPIGEKSKWIRFARSGWKSHRQMGKDFFMLRKNMRAFRENYLLPQGQRRLFFPGQLKRLSYQVYIVGSDQIWNPDITCGLRKEYFGAFKNKKKKKVIAYAASMGGAALSNKYDEEFSELLKSVDAISAREEAAIPYINQFYKKKVTAVLDPVFFLKREEWEKVEKLPDKEGYILVHMTERTQEMIDYTKKLSQDTGLPVVELRTNMGGITEESFSIVYTAGPAEFLGYIHKADYVVTNSFHMTAFSIIYQKRFIIFLHRSLGARIRNVLEIHGLENRLYEEGKVLDEDAFVDWSEVERRTEENIKVSENYLQKHLLELHVKKEDCCGCGACAAVCHTGALRMLWDDEGFRYPYIDKNLCVQCGRCEQVCPTGNESEDSDGNLYFGAQSKHEKIRHSSSSGGVFHTLAQYVLRRQGVVYGAGYSEHMEVIHQEISSEEQLDLIKRTKYVQSNVEGVYRKIEQQLKENRWVLFCGTPCQTKSLKLFLNHAYDKLILADLICYGVPSPGIWKDYVKYLEQEHGGRMTDFSFRDKRNQDNGHMRSYVIDDAEFSDSLYEDIYCRIYFTNYIIRPSCHSCKFCTVDRDSDLTIGDFWGIENVRPEVDDGMGTSLVILHTNKAKRVWDQVKDELNWFACEKDEVLQPRLQSATNVAGDRESFMQRYMTMPFSDFIESEQKRRMGGGGKLKARSTTLYLTFDDGPSKENTYIVLDVLKKRGVKATFFLVGEYIERYPDIAKQIVRDGHAIGIHCYSHNYNMIYKSVESYVDDFEKARRVTKEFLGIEPKIFRFPGGSNKEICKAIAVEMAKRDFVFFDWNAALEDAVIDPKPEELVENAVKSVHKDHGGREIVMLAHDRVEVTAACLDTILDQLSEYQMKVLDEKVKPVQFIKWQ